MKLRYLILILLLTSCSLKHDPYTTKDIWANMAFHVLNIADYSGTDKSLDDFPGEIIESNRWLGPNPSHQQLILTTLAVSAIYELIVYYTPAKYRWWAQAGGIGVKGAVVVKNANTYYGVGK
jgi:hypothetical protein